MEDDLEACFLVVGFLAAADAAEAGGAFRFGGMLNEGAKPWRELPRGGKRDRKIANQVGNDDGGVECEKIPVPQTQTA